MKTYVPLDKGSVGCPVGAVGKLAPPWYTGTLYEKSGGTMAEQLILKIYPL